MLRFTGEGRPFGSHLMQWATGGFRRRGAADANCERFSSVQGCPSEEERYYISSGSTCAREGEHGEAAGEVEGGAAGDSEPTGLQSTSGGGSVNGVVEPVGVDLDGDSGQTTWSKFIFALAITSGSYFMVVTIGSKDIYLLEFGADPVVLTSYWVALNCVAPLLNIVLGYVISGTTREKRLRRTRAKNRQNAKEQKVTEMATGGPVLDAAFPTTSSGAALEINVEQSILQEEAPKAVVEGSHQAAPVANYRSPQAVLGHLEVGRSCLRLMPSRRAAAGQLASAEQLHVQSQNGHHLSGDTTQTSGISRTSCSSSSSASTSTRGCISSSSQHQMCSSLSEHESATTTGTRSSNKNIGGEDLVLEEEDEQESASYRSRVAPLTLCEGLHRAEDSIGMISTTSTENEQTTVLASREAADHSTTRCKSNACGIMGGAREKVQDVNTRSGAVVEAMSLTLSGEGDHKNVDVTSKQQIKPAVRERDSQKLHRMATVPMSDSENNNSNLLKAIFRRHVLRDKTVDPVSMGQFGWWQLGSILIGSLASFAMWIGRPAGFVEVWYFLTALICWACYMIIVLVYDGARCCLYPYKEERVLVEGFTKAIFLAVVAMFAVIYMAYLMAPSRSMQFVVAIFSVAIGLTSLVSLDHIRRAQQPSTVDKEPPGIRAYWKAFWEYDANFWICLARFFTGAWEGIVAQNGIFYITYVSLLSRDERTFWVMLFAGLMSVVEIIFIPIWTSIFSDVKRRKSQIFCMQKLIGGFRAIDGVLMCIIISITGPGRGKASAAGLLVVACLGRFFFSPFTYWRISAQSWCVDEWTHLKGAREEALFYALHAFWYELGRGVVASLAFLGMAVIGGLVTRNCVSDCEGHQQPDNVQAQGYILSAHLEQSGGDGSDISTVTSLSELEKLCLDGCYRANQAEQPASLRTYLDFMYLVVSPFFEIVAAACVLRFPIEGERLLRLYENQSKAFQVVEVSPSLASPAKRHRGSDRPAFQPAEDN
ncbi:unnamed protein product [Amoebophrya sp. A25]|nr:unnamed protein product [Amoebophrya sp. A25]|eukprot:GSA25T00011928001.1